MDGLGDKTSMTAPINQEEVNFVNKKNCIIVIHACLCILTLFVFFAFNFYWASIYLIVWFISMIIVFNLMDGQIKST